MQLLAAAPTGLRSHIWSHSTCHLRAFTQHTLQDTTTLRDVRAELSPSCGPPCISLVLSASRVCLSVVVVHCQRPTTLWQDMLLFAVSLHLYVPEARYWRLLATTPSVLCSCIKIIQDVILVRLLSIQPRVPPSCMVHRLG